MKSHSPLITTNVFIQKTLNSLSAHKIKTILVLAVVNILAVWITAKSSVAVYGRVEAEGYRWATYSTLFKEEFITRIIYSAIDAPNAKTVSITNRYSHSEAIGNSYISLGEDDSIAISHNRIYSLDDECALFFSGREKLAMENLSLRCFY